MRISNDRICFVVIVYAWTWLCYCEKINAMIDSESKHASAWRFLKMNQEVSHCKYVNVNVN